ncbi:YeeE/YedE family protein [Acidomonas methanolica]|uniref:YeeE/YedE family protein n=1 Tax=Acidomonas methanolica TaxID=437 RepID=UPI00211A061E|nr:YeeE/YedE family protein [Acidomonas methanolica]MCQ9157122.1 YeeE/YedE family protein [Acidomonas methanolica]
MAWSTYLQSLTGGALIGAAAALFLLLNGRIAGISGILGRLLGPRSAETATNIWFVIGLLVGPLLFLGLTGRLPDSHVTAAPAVLIAGGLLVGFGTRLGSGCTSGHGVCGLARLSRRSFAAVGVFMTTAVAVVYLTHHLLPGVGP